MFRITIFLCIAALLSGCSYGQINEEYGPEGALAKRTYTSTQLGTTRQAQMNASQQDGESIYDLTVGEEVKTDPEFAKIAQDAFMLGRLLGIAGSGGIPTGGLRSFAPDGGATLDAPALTRDEQAAIYRSAVDAHLAAQAEGGGE